MNKPMSRLTPQMIMAIVMILMGISMMVAPSAISSTMESTFRLAAGPFGLIQVTFGILLIKKRGLLEVIALTTPVLVYIAACIVYAIQHPGTSPVFIVLYVGLYAMMLRMFYTHGSYSG